ncbi:MAG: glycerophosphodiester phosphodiesterase [Solirubrobacterales bacterium]|nr:glycerophosphodiester phosphodiesterase [Solirubrobacterales bacterium]
MPDLEQGAHTPAPPPPPGVRRIGHKGADFIVPGNTLASFDAALAAGVDMIEFDILPENVDGTGELFLAHDYRHIAGAPTLAEGLAHFAADAFASVHLDVDLKLPGYETRVCRALREAGLADRSLISTMEELSLPLVRAAAPEIRVGWSVPKVRRDYLAHPVTKPLALAAVLWARRAIPPRVLRRVRAGQIDAVMAHWALVDRGFAAAIRDAGAELYVWTVDELPLLRRLEATPGVTGIAATAQRASHLSHEEPSPLAESPTTRGCSTRRGSRTGVE